MGSALKGVGGATWGFGALGTALGVRTEETTGALVLSVATLSAVAGALSLPIFWLTTTATSTASATTTTHPATSSGVRRDSCGMLALNESPAVWSVTGAVAQADERKSGPAVIRPPCGRGERSK